MTIPNTINGLLVTSIGLYYDIGYWHGAFESCGSLNSVRQIRDDKYRKEVKKAAK